ncbi:MAG: hypothetical protein JXR67_10950 [Bacteroidales bacterium]|nr:hypothetical protein [Bacteroidales bacterium]
MKTHYNKNCKKIILVLLAMVTLLSDSCSKKEPYQEEALSVILISQNVTTFLGQDGSIETEVSGGLPPYRFNWSNGETTEDIHGLSAGTYSVTVTDDRDSTVNKSIKITQPIPADVIMDIEGNFYNTVKIGEQTWMKQNLRVEFAPDSSGIESFLYDNNPAYEETYGRLYSWDVAMNGSTAENSQGICPDGWHIPSDEEWKELEIHLGMTRQEADMTNTWRGYGAGTKLAQGGESGYEALFAGRRTSYGTYSLFGSYEYMWTSTEYGQNAWRRCLEKGVSTVGRWNTFPKTYGFSVRCVKDK